jgi:hypothetical protein
MTNPYFYPHAKGFGYHPMGGTFLTVAAIFLGGILLIKLVTSIIGLVMFNRWKKEGFTAPEDWESWKGHRFHPYHSHCGLYHGPWKAYPHPPAEHKSKEATVEDKSDQAE